jgi:hypothetical protein
VRNFHLLAMGSTALALTLTVTSAYAEASSAAAATSDAAPPGAAAAPQPSNGGDFLSRFFSYYAAEAGKTGPDADPNAPPARRADFPPSPAPQPPYPFTEWPYGAATSLGVTRPNSVDSPLMVALAPTGLGKAMQDAHVQVYGWVNVGGNLSSNKVEGGNAPAAYDYNPNRIQLDQAVIYVERTPDTVQKDHMDWGFRASAIYGVDYRYTTSYGLASYQLLKDNKSNGYDFPMIYGELYVPNVMAGLLIRVGRYISIPDIEAQLAPNNYMYSHSMTYTFDNYTNTGIVATVALNKNWFVQAGVVEGTDTAIGNVGKRRPNPYPNPLYPGSTFLKDPGSKPSFVGCVRYQSSSANDDLYVCMDGINNGTWGYNNLQWYGFTYYHKFTDKFHVAFEMYNLHEANVPNLNNPIASAAISNGGTPFSPQYIPFNAPGAALCHSANTLTCTATTQGMVAYWNYQFTPLDNLSLRTEYFDDRQGQRTGVATSYDGLALGVQHWLSPQIEFRPEIAWYRANDGKAFNGNANHGIAPSRQQATILSGDAIIHF